MKKIINNKSGQAIFEMIIFLPFLIFFYTIFYTVGNSISASINQQKAVRAYFFQLVKGNSYIVPGIDLRTSFAQESMKKVGFYAIGWNETMKGDTPVSNCFKFNSMLKNNSKEECDSKNRTPPESSKIIRAFTVFGVCGPIFSLTNATSENSKKYIVDQATQLSGAIDDAGNPIPTDHICGIE